MSNTTKLKISTLMLWIFAGLLVFSWLGCPCDDVGKKTCSFEKVTGQCEITMSPETIELEAVDDTDIGLVILAIDKLVSPAINGQTLISEMLTDSLLLLCPDGTVAFSYTDQFFHNFRTRTQYIPNPEEENLEDLLALPENDAEPKPKVLCDADISGAEILRLGPDDSLRWTGDLVYKFDFGLPLLSLDLSSIDGLHKTMVEDSNWDTDDRAVVISASNDGTAPWTEIWRSQEDGGKTEVTATLPASLLGQQTVYLKFNGQENQLMDLYVSAILDASDLTSLLSMNTGSNQLKFTDAAESSHNAILFWEGEGVSQNTIEIEYPDSQPTVTKSDDDITVLFPEEVGIIFKRKSGKGIMGIKKLYVGQREILSNPRSVPISGSSLDILSEFEIDWEETLDWPSYLLERKANGYKWPSSGERTVKTVKLEDADYLEPRIDSGSVSLPMQIDDGDVSGEVEWILSPVDMQLGGRDYHGLGWKVKVGSGLEQAMYLHVTEPVAALYDDWAFAQIWGNFIETHLDFSTSFNFPKSWYPGQTQPFFFEGGSKGAIVSFFDKVVGARVAVDEEAGKLLNTLQVPFGELSGNSRETPLKYWLWTDDTFSTKWTALDEWTSLYDAIAKRYRSAHGLGVTEPKPVIWANFPKEAYMDEYYKYGSPDYLESFHYLFAHNELPEAAELGFRALHFDMHWLSDAVPPPGGEYLPGSASETVRSGNAPWYLEINDALGGEKALKELSDAAKDLGVKIILWIPPAHLSNSSPLFIDNPKQIKWQIGGIPEDGIDDYPDISGTSMNSDWYKYATGQYQKIQQATGFDGVLMDSFLTFCMYPDYNEQHPTPQITQALDLQRDLQQINGGDQLTEIYIEGCAPFGLSSGDYAYEASIGGDPEGVALVRERFERIKGREYGLYRYIADTLVQPDSYYRALASKGVITVWNLDELNKMSEEDISRIKQANLDYMSVLNKMEHRTLIARENTWKGVSWTNETSEEVVLFAFDSFDYSLAGCKTVALEDVTSGTTKSTGCTFRTESMHTYIITPQE